MQQQQLYLQHYLYSSSNIRNVTQCSSSNYTYSITYIAAVTSAMLLNAVAVILTALLIITALLIYHIAGNFRKVLFSKISKMVKHFRKHFFEIAR